MLKKSPLVLLSCIVALFICSSCSSKNKGMDTMTATEQPDYSLDFSWVSKAQIIDKSVDVFYVYPTIYRGTQPKNMDISDSTLRKNAKGLTISQAGVCTPYANLFAPFYRQQSAALQSMAAGNAETDALHDPVFLVGAKDVERAFDYYIKNLNHDRPFIIAGHSQGTMALIHLMQKRFNDPELQKRLVAAYLIGYTVTKNDLGKYPWMKLAQSATDTGVIITFNTEGLDAGPSPVLLPGAVAINPLNWKTDGTPANRNANLGAKIFNNMTGEILEEIPHFAAAHIDTKKGVLIATNIKPLQTVDLDHMGRWPKGVYHKLDYSFWFNNLKANVKKRIIAYQEKL